MKIHLIGILGISLLLTACGNKEGNYDASGIFEATEVMVSAKNTGELVHFDIQEGQELIAEAQLGYIDSIPLYLKKVQLMANMQVVDSRQYNVTKQVAATKQQLATQKKELLRFESLVKAKAANQKQVDDIQAQIALLEKQLSAQIESLENNNKSLSGEGLVLQAQIAQIDDQLSKCNIKSPITGVVLAKYAQQGEFATTGRNLFKVADIANLYLRVYITADQLTSLRIGQEVKVYADQGKSDRKEYSGKVLWISDKAEFTPKTIQTREERANLVYAVKIAVANDGLIKRGMYGEIKIH